MALERILERTREDLARRMVEAPVSSFGRIAPSDRSFEAALRQGRTGFILECKRASPSEGLIRAEFDPDAIAREYAPFADAISVLTDAPFFQGSLEHLATVREAVSVPVLRKDFVVDPYQVLEARAHGADAVLLMLSVLDDAGYRECAAAAQGAGIATLTEVHSERELDRALALDAPVIGINNRDLTTLTVDLGTTRRLAAKVPTDRVLVCESGIATHHDVRALRELVDGFLVGTSLMRDPDLGGAVRRVVHGITKVCGLTREDDARCAWDSGATHGGVIFAEESPRRVSVERAGELVRSAPLRWVGVFVNAPVPEVVDIARRLGLAAVQLHGEESPGAVTAIRTHLNPACEVWKAVRVRDEIPRVDSLGACRMVLDRFDPVHRGGTGQRFDWTLLEGHPDLDRIVLGGGLDPESAGEAEATGVWGLDVNSGVEAGPGIKDHQLIRDFLANRRGVGRRRPEA